MRTTLNHYDDAARAIQDKFSLTGEFHDLESKAARLIRTEIIRLLRSKLCYLEFYENKYEEHEKELEKAVGPDGCWRDGWRVHEELTLTIGCVQITLNPEGTYHLSDISG